VNRRTFQSAPVLGLLAAVSALAGCGRSPQSTQTPEATVDELFDAAERGDDQAYLRLTSRGLRESLQSARSELGVAAFRDHLRRSAAGIKGLAKTRSDDASLPDGTVALDVELVFADRNERQRMLLQPKGNGWVIISIDTARMVNPSIPYGTPVFEEPEQEEAREQGQQ
jgi:hypothetical protein